LTSAINSSNDATRTWASSTFALASILPGVTDFTHQASWTGVGAVQGLTASGVTNLITGSTNSPNFVMVSKGDGSFLLSNVVTTTARYTVQDTVVTNLHLVNDVNISDTGIDGWSPTLGTTVPQSNGVYIHGILNVMNNTNLDGADGITWWTKYANFGDLNRHVPYGETPRFHMAVGANGLDWIFALVNFTNGSLIGTHGDTNSGSIMGVSTNSVGKPTLFLGGIARERMKHRLLSCLTRTTDSQELKDIRSPLVTGTKACLLVVQ